MRRFPLSILVALIFVLPTVCSATEIYITQNISGGNTGADCANAHSASWFNSNATGGNTYHLCGTFNGAAGSTMLIVPNGSAGNTLTVLFEPGAVLTAPYWGGQSAGAINIPAHSFIKIDGGTNGIIKNTLNGTPGNTCPGGTCPSPTHASQGIYIQAGSTNIEIANLTIQDIYDQQPNQSTGDPNATSAADILVSSGGGSNISIHDCTLKAAYRGIGIDWDGGTASNINIYNNSISDHAFGVQIGSWVASGSSSNVNIHGNTITNWSNWNSTADDYYHTDGIIVWGHQGFPTVVNIYNNHIFGSFNGTGEIYCTYDGLSGTGSASLCTIFNNVFQNSLTSCSSFSGCGPGRSIWTGANTGPHTIVNNTFIGSGSGVTSSLISIDGSIATLENNIFYNSGQAVGSYSTTFPLSNLTASNYNLYNTVSGSPFIWNTGSAGRFISYAQWQAGGYDANGVTGRPNLSGTYTLQSGSAAIGAGKNLTSLGIAALNSDAAGVARPSTAAWDIGAFQFSQTINIAPPTGLSAIVQ